jgi:hypothetical protein
MMVAPRSSSLPDLPILTHMIRARHLIPVLAIVLALPVAANAGEVPQGLHTGVYSDDFYATGDLNGIANQAGQRVTFGGTFHNVTENDGVETVTWSNTREILEGVWEGRATPFSNVIVDASAFRIARGDFDAKIAEWRNHVKKYLDLGGGRSVIVAPLQEHNGNWTSYGCDPANFKAAYRKFVTSFRNAGIDETKVRFAWAPNGWTSPGCGTLADYYPGDAWVDVIGISSYNFGTCVPNGEYQTPSQAFDPYLNEIRTTVTDTKPLLIAQTASSRYGCGGNQSAWVQTMIEHLSGQPDVVGFVWFNFVKETDWRTWTGSSLTQGWVSGVQAGHTSYEWPLTSWFQPGDLTLGPPPPPPCPSKKSCDSIVTIDSGSQWGRWDRLESPPSVKSFFFGDPGDVPFMGDWDGDGVATPGLYRQSDGFVYVRFSNSQGVADREFFFGDPGDVPLVGDFDGDGRDSVSIWRASEARVYVINELGGAGKGLGAAEFSFAFGNPGDAPFVGDFDGDGVDSVGLYRESTGFVYFRDSLSSGVADKSFFFGDPGDRIVAGDWDGDGRDSVGVYRASTGRFYVSLENAAGPADWHGYVGSYPYLVTAGNT